MHLSVLNPTQSSSSDLWRWQIGRPLRQRRRRGPRNLAVVTYVPRGKSKNNLIDIRRLTVCILQDEFDHSEAPRIRFAAYRLVQVPWGVNVGGRDQINLEKDLALAPRRRAYGCRFGRNDQRWIPLALTMDRCLERHARHPYMPRTTELRLPKFWAAIKTTYLTGDGPEFAKLCEDFQLPPEVALLTCARRYRGHILYPLEFVSHAWRQFSTVFADVSHLFQRQVIRLDGSAQLAGFHGACQYDLLNPPHWRMPD